MEEASQKRALTPLKGAECRQRLVVRAVEGLPVRRIDTEGMDEERSDPSDSSIGESVIISGPFKS